MVCKWKSLRGCALLNRYFSAEGRGSQRELADTLATTEQLVHAWRIGYRRPGPEFRAAIERIARIPRAAWQTPNERARERRLERAGSGHGEAAPNRSDN